MHFTVDGETRDLGPGGRGASSAIGRTTSSRARGRGRDRRVLSPIRSDWDEKVVVEPRTDAEVAEGVSLYKLRRGLPELVEPAVVVALDGWVDAGSAATNAAATLALGAGSSRLSMATRSSTTGPATHAPDRARQAAQPRWPELTMRATKVGERDLLVLTGAEPDYAGTSSRGTSWRWRSTSASRSGSASARSRPPCPTPRPVPILGTESKTGLLQGERPAGPEGILRVPAAAISVFDISVTKAGIPAVGYFAQIPHYVSGRIREASIGCCARWSSTSTSSSTSGACPRTRG
jgi:hypothetical protein